MIFTAMVSPLFAQKSAPATICAATALAISVAKLPAVVPVDATSAAEESAPAEAASETGSTAKARKSCTRREVGDFVQRCIQRRRRPHLEAIRPTISRQHVGTRSTPNPVSAETIAAYKRLATRTQLHIYESRYGIDHHRGTIGDRDDTCQIYTVRNIDRFEAGERAQVLAPAFVPTVRRISAEPVAL